MDLFYTSNILSETAISSAYLYPEAHSHHPDFIRFLQVATALEVEILPLTWDPALEALGQEGATSRVNQSPLNSKIAFAFKRFNPRMTKPDLSCEVFRQMQYNAMITEMVILSSRVIRRHENIVTFVGVCFELSTVSDEVWPVLVFTKAGLGDLSAFISQYGHLDAGSLAAICGEIAKGIDIMHKCGVVHGDIKPANVLVEENVDPHGVLIKVSDFGFSTFNSADDDLVKVTRTEPWEAPEWHPRYFSLKNVMKMDIYSFGMLCFWIFFREERITELGEASITVEDALLCPDAEITARVQSLKQVNDSFLECALRLLKEAEDIDDEDRIRIERAFRLTLTEDLGHRAESMNELVELLGVAEDESETESRDSVAPVTLPGWHGTLQVEKMFFHLDSSDFRIHSFIVKTLKLTAGQTSCDGCGKNAAFQLAVCFSFGFGVPRDDNERDMWLEKSGRGIHDLECALDRIKTENKKSTFIAGLYEMGYRSNLLDRYRDDGLMPEATEKCKMMVKCREELFGSSHYSTLRMKSLLVDILSWEGKFTEALPLALDNVKSAGDDIDVRDRLTLRNQIAYIYEHTGRVADAVALRHNIVQEYGKDTIKSHPSRLVYQTQLGSLLLAQGKHEEALEIGLNVEKEAVLRLGPHHATSLAAKRLLVEAYDSAGQLEFSTEIHEDLVRAREHSSRPDHGVLIEDLSVLGVQYYRLGKLDLAMGCYEKVKAMVARKVENAIPAVTSVNNYAATLLRFGNIEEGIIILQNLLKESENVLGSDCEETVAVMGNLAAGYQKQHKWQDAETLEKQVLDYRRRVLGDKHHHTLSAFGNLTKNLTHQRKWVEVSTICKQELAIRDTIEETSDGAKISMLSTIATALTLSNAYDEAIGVFTRLFALEQARQTDGPTLHLRAMVLAAMCQAKLSRLSETRSQLTVILSTLQRPWKDVPTAIVDHLTYLAEACNEHQWDAETEQILAAAGLVADKYAKDIDKKAVEKFEEVVRTFLSRLGKSELVFSPEAIADGSLEAAMTDMTLDENTPR